MKLNAYLHFKGNCKAAFEYYEKVLGGKIVMISTYGEAPMEEKCSPESNDLIMHATLMVGDQILMGSDAPPQYQEDAQGFSVSLLPDSIEDAERVFAALSENGTVRMPIGETFWATRFGMVVDQFGTPWMVNYMENVCA
jgi:PhnB protein